MYDIVTKKVQITKSNKDAFKENINIIMTNRKDAEQVFFKWIQESNPNIGYNEVADLYKDLSRTIEAQREGFFIQEKMLQDIKLQHDNLIDLFPNSLFLSILGRNKLNYKPVSSSFTEKVFETGKDDNKNLNL